MGAGTFIIDPGEGAGHDYHSLFDWEAAQQANLTGTGPCIVKCRATDGDADTTAFVIDGWTTTAADYIKIWTDTAESYRHAGVWTTARYRLVAANASAMKISEDFVRVDGLQLNVTSMTANYQCCINIGTIGAGSDIRVSNCILKGCTDATYREPGIAADDTDINISVWNCIIYNIGQVVSQYATPIYCNVATANIYSCTLIGGNYGIRAQAGTIVAKNTYCGASSVEDFYRYGGSLAKTNCASEDQSADDTGTGETATNCVAAAVAIDTDTFVNVTVGSEDFHLAADDNSPLQGTGTSTTGDSAPLDFTTDIAGSTRDATWDIGAFCDVAAAGGYIPYPFSRGARGGIGAMSGGLQ